MNLSDEQMNIISGPGVSDFEPFDLPTGRQQLPSWVRGAYIDWMNGCSNAPTVKLKVVGNVRNWPDQVWVKEGDSCYIARHEDGRAEVLYHSGPVSKVAVWRVFAGEEPITYQWIVPTRKPAETWLQAAEREADEHVAKILSYTTRETIRTYQNKVAPVSSLRREAKEIDATTQQDGFGGSGYMLRMADGSDRLLRGPWHGGAPAGYVEVNPIDITAPYHRQNQRRPRPWFRNGGTCSYVTEDLLLRILAHYAPHVGVCRVTHSYGERLECFDQRWGMPKAQIYEIERHRDIRKEPAGPHWRVYWDGSERYCGSLRMPSHGFQEGITT